MQLGHEKLAMSACGGLLLSFFSLLSCICFLHLCNQSSMECCSCRNLQEWPTLRIEDGGRNVHHLHVALQRRGYSFQADDSQWWQFGDSTFNAVQVFQVSRLQFRSILYNMQPLLEYSAHPFEQIMLWTKPLGLSRSEFIKLHLSGCSRTQLVLLCPCKSQWCRTIACDCFLWKNCHR